MFWNKKEKRRYTYAFYIKSYLNALEELEKLNDDILSGELELVKESNIHKEDRMEKGKTSKGHYKGYGGDSDLVYREPKPVTLEDIITGITGEVTAENMKIKYEDGVAVDVKIPNRDYELFRKEKTEDKADKKSYYNRYPQETIDMMCDVFGEEDTATYCLINAFKYRMRMGLKDCMKKDLKKEQWYLDKYKELSMED